MRIAIKKSELTHASQNTELQRCTEGHEPIRPNWELSIERVENIKPPEHLSLS